MMEKYGRSGRNRVVIPAETGIPVISKLYDDLGNLLVEASNWVVYFRETEVTADTELNLSVGTDLNLETGGDFNNNITGDENHLVGDTLGITAENDINVTASNGEIALTGETDFSITAATGKLNLTGFSGITAGGIKLGNNQAAAGAAAGELWVNTTAVPYTICMGI
jgi:hypothetical protein